MSVGVQVDLSTGSRTVTTLAIEAAIKEVTPPVAIAASEAAEEADSEVASIPSADAAAKAAAKRAKKQRQKAKKQQRQGAPHLQQPQQQDALTEGVQQLAPQQACSPQHVCSGATRDSCATTTSMAATVVDSQQTSRDEPQALPEATAASAASMPAESVTVSEASAICAISEDAVQAPTLGSETTETDACRARAQQTSLDSAESPPCVSGMHSLQVLNISLSKATSERDAYQGVSKVCTQELPFCDLKHSLDMVWLPGKDERLPVCDLPGASNLLCCPFTKVGFMTASQRL